VAIFGKNDKLQSAPPALPEEPVRAASAGGPAPSTVVGPKARFAGEISGNEDVLVHGRLEGNIEVGGRVIVAASGEHTGDIHAKAIVVGGRVRGEIRADERAELLASASVQGNIYAPKVVIAEGAQIQGSVAMSTPETPPPAPPRKKTEEQ
jgi:cytoskeletal protein CcmA (bactofilin family)